MTKYGKKADAVTSDLVEYTTAQMELFNETGTKFVITVDYNDGIIREILVGCSYGNE